MSENPADEEKPVSKDAADSTEESAVQGTDDSTTTSEGESSSPIPQAESSADSESLDAESPAAESPAAEPSASESPAANAVENGVDTPEESADTSDESTDTQDNPQSSAPPPRRSSAPPPPRRSSAPPPPFSSDSSEDGASSTTESSISTHPELGSVAEPIRAMRVIRLDESSVSRPAPAPVPSSPSIETDSATLEELEDELTNEEKGQLQATPMPAPVSVETDDEQEAPEPPLVEEDEAYEELSEETELSSEETEGQETKAKSRRHRQDTIPEMVVPATERKPPPPRRSAKPSLPRAQKMRKKPWWETLFGDDFSRAYRPMTESQLRREVDFILSQLNVPAGAVILDLGCGQGEICVELARRGYSVVGYDLSVYQLAMAGDHAQLAKQKINFLQGDVREMAFEQMFDAVICWDTTFGYFEEEKNLEVLGRIKNALKPNGRLLMDVMNRDFAAREAPYNHWFEGDGCVCMDDMSMDWITNRLKVKRSIILDDGRSKELQYSVRLYTLSELGRMMHDSGFRVAAVSGDVATQGAFFGPHSPRIIISAGKP